MLTDISQTPPVPFILDRRAVVDADALIAAFGNAAAGEAALRADRSRDIGNTVRFCHWRQTERLVVLLSLRRVVGTVH